MPELKSRESIKDMKIISVRAVNVESQEQADEMFSKLNRIFGTNIQPTESPLFKEQDDGKEN